MKCPRCNAVLTPSVYEGEQVEVCPECEGEWLSAGQLESIIQHHDQVFTAEEIASIQGVNKEIFTAEQNDHDELNCPQCHEVQMEHFNYGETSGIILHKCLQCHGVWMDKDELVQVEEVVDGWKGYLGEDLAKYGPILDKVAAQEELELEKDVSISRFGFVNSMLRHFTQ